MEKRDWTPSAEIFEKIADYLDCSVDYLLGRTDNPEVNKQGGNTLMGHSADIDFEKIASDVLSKISRGNQTYLSEHPGINTKQYEESAKIATAICVDVLKAYHAELIKNPKPH